MTEELKTNRLGLKLMLVAASAFVLLVVATVLIILFGFRNALQSAVEKSIEGLEAQVNGTMTQVVEQEGRIYAERLATVTSVANIAAQLFVSQTNSAPTPNLVQGAEGQWYDATPNRQSEVLLPRGYDFSESLDDQRDSAVLEDIFPTLLSQLEEAVAIYFVGTSGLARYYPVIDLHTTQAATMRATEQSFFANVAPAANPTRQARWSSPYEDTAGQGRLVTMTVPIYQGDVFRGVIGVDVSVDKLAERLDELVAHMTPRGLAFLVDARGRLVATDEQARGMLIKTDADLEQPLWEVGPPELSDLFRAMSQGEKNIDNLSWDGKEYLVVFTPISEAGWSFGTIVPYDQLLTVIYEFAETILADSRGILVRTLIITVLVLLLTLLAIAYWSRHALTRPIEQLVQGTRALAQGNLGTQVPVQSRDELGQLAQSFNAMSTQLARAKDQEREIEKLYHTVSEAKILVEIANSVHFEDDLTTTLQKIAKAVVDNTNLVGCVLTTTGEDNHPWSIRVSHGFPKAFVETVEKTIADGAPMKMSAQARQTRERVIIPNWSDYVRREPSLSSLLPWAEKPQWESVVCVPLLTRTQLVGTAYFYFPLNAVLSEQVLNLFDAVANQVALTIENAFLLEQTRRAEREARTLSAVAAVVADPSSVDSSLNRIAQRVVEISGAEACAIYVLEGGLPLRVAGAYGLPEGYNEAIASSWREGARSAALIAFEERQVLKREHLRDDTMANPEYRALHPFIQNVAWQKGVFAPLLLGERALGTLVTYYPDGPPLEHNTVQFVKAIADQVVVAVENARLFLEVQNKAGLEERQKLARELHDSVSQALFSIALSARTAKTLLKRGQAENALEPVEYTLSLAEAGIAEMRALIFELRPESLEQEGLKMALSKQAASVQARHQMQVKLELGDEPSLNLKTKEALYRIAQEALHNIVKHASASEVEIRLQTRNNNVILEIRDDGKGFDTSLSKPGHLGLHSMRERAQGVGASFEVESEVGKGTTIRLSLPY